MKISYITRLRVLGCLAIILLHVCTSAAIIYKDSISLSQYTITYGMVYFLFFAVPCFVMISGALLLDPKRDISLKTIYKKYVLRLVLALFFAILVFRIFSMIMDGEAFSVGYYLTGLLQFFTDGSWSHLWYIYMMIGLYILLPLFRAVTAQGSPVLIRYLIIVLFIFSSLLPLTNIWDVQSGFYIQISTVYPLYFLLGYAIHSGIIPIKRAISALAFVLGSLLTVGAVVYYYIYGISQMEFFLSYSSPLCVIQSIGLFGLFKNTLEDSSPRALTRSIDNCSLGIYLIHMIFVRLILRYLEFNPYEYGFWSIFVLTICIFIVSYLIIFAAKALMGIFKKK